MLTFLEAEGIKMNCTNADVVDFGLSVAAGDMKYAEILKSAYEKNPLPEEKTPGKRGRKKKGKIRVLIERLDKYKGAVCFFSKTSKLRLITIKLNVIYE